MACETPSAALCYYLSDPPLASCDLLGGCCFGRSVSEDVVLGLRIPRCIAEPAIVVSCITCAQCTVCCCGMSALAGLIPDDCERALYII